MLFLEAKASARPRMMQLTTIRGMNTPRFSARAGTKAWSSRSTMVTKVAMTTMKQAMRILLGMILRSREMTTLAQMRMMVTDRPMPMPLKRVVVMASTEHMPRSCTSTGFWVIRPSLNWFFTFMTAYLLSPAPRRPPGRR